MAGRRIGYILTLGGCCVFYLLYEEWFSWVTLLTVLLLPWFSLLLSLRAMLCMKIKLTVPERVPKGTDATVRVEAQSHGITPHFCCRIKVLKPITGESIIIRPDGNLPTEHCGGLAVRTERAKVYDYMGLFSIKVRKPPVSTVRVMPDTVELPIPEELTRFLARTLKPKRGGGYADIHEIRPYRPGDALNLVHWKLSAKTDELMLREPMEPDSGMMLLTLDVSGTSEELDRKFARLQYYGKYLLANGMSFRVLALTGKGTENWVVREESDREKCIDELMCAPFTPKGTLSASEQNTPWRYHIGGEPYEA